MQTRGGLYSAFLPSFDLAQDSYLLRQALGCRSAQLVGAG